MLTNKAISIAGFLSECICIHFLPAHRAAWGFSLPAAAAPAVPGSSSRACRLGWETPAEKRGLLPTREPKQGCAERGGGFRGLGSPPSPWRTTSDNPRHPLVLCSLTHPGGEADPPRWRAISKSVAGGGRSFPSPRALPGPNKSRPPAAAPGCDGRGDHGDFTGRPPPARRGALREGKSGAPSGSKQKINPPSSLPAATRSTSHPVSPCLPKYRRALPPPRGDALSMPPVSMATARNVARVTGRRASWDLALKTGIRGCWVSFFFFFIPL